MTASAPVRVLYSGKEHLAVLSAVLKSLGYAPRRRNSSGDVPMTSGERPAAWLIPVKALNKAAIRQAAKTDPSALFVFSPRRLNLPPDTDAEQIFPGDGADALRQKLNAGRKVAELRKRLIRSRSLHAEESRYREILADVLRTVNSSLETDVVIEVVMDKIRSLIDAEAWSLLLRDQNGRLVFRRAMGPKGEVLTDMAVPDKKSIAGWVADKGEPIIVNDVRRDKRFNPIVDRKTGFRTRSILCAPLLSRGKVIGVLEVINKRGHGGFTPEDMTLLCTLVEPAAIALENAMLFDEIRRLTVTDDLTRLHNVRFFNEILEREVRRVSRYGGKVSLVFLDLDNFKTVNDHHGHLAGSQTLREVGALLAEHARASDILCRYGGDEFTMVLPQTDAEGGHIIAERTRCLIAGQSFLNGMNLSVRISASFGVATFPDHASGKEDLIQAADAAMYRIKMSGKNNVAVAPLLIPSKAMEKI